MNCRVAMNCRMATAGWSWPPPSSHSLIMCWRELVKANACGMQAAARHLPHSSSRPEASRSVATLRKHLLVMRQRHSERLHSIRGFDDTVAYARCGIRYVESNCRDCTSQTETEGALQPGRGPVDHELLQLAQGYQFIHAGSSLGVPSFGEPRIAIYQSQCFHGLFAALDRAQVSLRTGHK